MEWEGGEGERVRERIRVRDRREMKRKVYKKRVGLSLESLKLLNMVEMSGK